MNSISADPIQHKKIHKHRDNGIFLYYSLLNFSQLFKDTVSVHSTAERNKTQNSMSEIDPPQINTVHHSEKKKTLIKFFVKT